MTIFLSKTAKPLIALIMLLLAVSCGSKKIVSDGTLSKNMSAQRIVRAHYQNETDFKTISGKMRIDYKNKDDSQGVTVSLRMEKDKAIWISAPFGVVKAMITPGRVTFYNKLQNEYFDGDFSYLSKFVGVELNFQQVQNLLVGQALLDLKTAKYEATLTTDAYELKPLKSEELFKILFQIEPKNFKMASQQLSQPDKKRLLQINYNDYQKIDQWVLPQNIAIAAIDKEKRSTIDIEYRNIEFNRNLSFPYAIPSGYDEIKLKEDAL